jgi:hypothetical protein
LAHLHQRGALVEVHSPEKGRGTHVVASRATGRGPALLSAGLVVVYIGLPAEGSRDQHG